MSPRASLFLTLVLALSTLVFVGGCVDDPAELAQDEQEIGINPTCDRATLWLYDGPNLTGHRLCLSGAGIAFLTDYPRTGGGTWSGAVRSYWAGWQAGRLTGVLGGLPVSTPFVANQKVLLASPAAQAASAVVLN